MTFNFKTIAIICAVIIFYQFLVYGLWISLRWTITPYTSTTIRTVTATAIFILANFTILAYILQLGAPYRNYGQIWFFYFLYGSIIAIILIIIKFILKYFNINLSQGISLTIATSFLIVMTAFGLFNAYSPIVKESTIKVNKKLDKPVKIAVVADLHLGTFFGNNALKKLNTIIEGQKPDALIIAGDLMDDDMTMYKKTNMQKNLTKLAKTVPVYITMGNHDNEAKKIVEEVSKTGVTTLLDEHTTFNGITLVGRKDKIDTNRLETAELLTNIDKNKPIILIDHQPYDITKHSTLSIDVQLSGHTHHGQLWPFNYITERLYVLDYGYANINDKHFFTTAGYGFWGPPFKTTTRSEILMITIEGN